MQRARVRHTTSARYASTYVVSPALEEAMLSVLFIPVLRLEPDTVHMVPSALRDMNDVRRSPGETLISGAVTTG